MKRKTIIILTGIILLGIIPIGNFMLAQCANTENIYSFNYAGHTYEVVKENKTWNDATACAVERGGYLTEINTEAEQNTIFNEISNNAGINNSETVATEGGGASYLWIGGNDLSSEGTWIWDGDNDGNGTQFWQGYLNGSVVSGLYNNWGHGTDGAQHEPDNYHNDTYNIPHQNALAISLTEWQLGSGNLGQVGQWNDLYENNTLYYIIEYDSIKSTDGTVGDIPLNGSGTASDPYQISTLEDLVWLAKTDSVWDSGLYFIQTADIDASATDTMAIAGFNPGWSPIGNAVTAFIGHYDGSGHTIDGLVTHGNSSNTGFFGIVKLLEVKNLGLTNVQMSAAGRSGALIGTASDSLLIINNCYATGNIQFNGPFGGGLIGVIKNTKFEIRNSYTDINVTNVLAGDYAFTGGFISYIELFGDNDNTGIIEDCYSKGDVTLTDQAAKSSHVGGFIAKLGGDEDHTKWSEIRRCYSTSNVIASIGYDGFSPAGGFIGEADWRYNISECYSTGNVISKGKDTGGFIGYLKYAGHVENCYSTGDVTRVEGSTQSYFGGFIGWQRPWGVYYNTIEKCYSTGKVIGVDQPGYGFLGGKTSPCVDTLNYWDKEASEQDSTIGNAIGLTTAEMKTQSSFVGWDFENIWEIVGDDYPTLRAYMPDTEPPTPNPIRFVVLPHASSENELTMIAAEATDPSGIVFYKFNCINDPLKSSDWQTSSKYVAKGLEADSVYTFTVIAKDLYGNTTGASVEVKGRTLDGLFYTEHNGVCVIEAERAKVSINADSSGNASPFDAPMAWYECTEDSGYVGTGYMTTEDGVALNTSWNKGTELCWKVYITTPGEYFISARKISKTGGDDSAWLGVDSVQVGDRVFDVQFTEFAWRTPTSGLSIGNLTEGMHTIQVRRREDGFELDRLMISTDKDALPPNASTEAGPAETARADSIVSVEKELNNIPMVFSLKQNYPNPFNPTTVIKFSLPKASEVNLSVYNILGQKVVSLVNKELAQGTYEYQFDASNLTSGIYFYKLQANKYSQVKKMLLIK